MARFFVDDQPIAHEDELGDRIIEHHTCFDMFDAFIGRIAYKLEELAKELPTSVKEFFMKPEVQCAPPVFACVFVRLYCPVVYANFLPHEKENLL